MKIALVYDRVNKWGGAERVMLALNELFPKAPLYTAVYSRQLAPWARVFPEVIPTFLQKIPFLNKHHELLGTFTPMAFEALDLGGFDVVISVTSEAAKGVITKPTTKHICYCLTPTRYLWSGYEEYRNNPPKQLKMFPYYKQISKPLLNYVRKWDLIASQRPDNYVAISKAVQMRIEKYYNKETEIIYPPVDVEKFKNQNSKAKKKKDYYLVLGRLVPYKRVDLAVGAFNKLGKKLVVVGTGSEEASLKRIAKKNVQMKGFVEEKDLPGYYAGAKALIHPQDEDFGITPVEAQAAGTPVIAFGRGGVLDTVINKRTGILFNNQTEEGLIEAVEKLEKLEFSQSEIIRNAQRFSKDIFLKRFDELVQKIAK